MERHRLKSSDILYSAKNKQYKNGIKSEMSEGCCQQTMRLEAMIPRFNGVIVKNLEPI